MHTTAEAPSITSGPYRELSLAVGQSTTLKCHAAGAPAPQLAWYRGLLLPNSTDKLVASGFKLELKVVFTSFCPLDAMNDDCSSSSLTRPSSPIGCR